MITASVLAIRQMNALVSEHVSSRRRPDAAGGRFRSWRRSGAPSAGDLDLHPEDGFQGGLAFTSGTVWTPGSIVDWLGYRRIPIAIGIAVLLAMGGTSLILARQAAGARERADLYQMRLGAATSRLDAATATATQQTAVISELKSQLTAIHGELAEVRASKIRTVVETEIVTKEVPRWVPSGKGIDIETTGFDDRIAIRDVQLTYSYGYTHLIGIAINRSGQTISYAQLGCTFVDADGRLVANEMANKAGWAPGQSWGFDCSAQVDATGGIVRVDEMT